MGGAEMGEVEVKVEVEDIDRCLRSRELRLARA